MPLKSILSFENTLIGIWHMSEPSGELAETLQWTESELQEFRKYSSEKRKREFLSVRLLLDKMQMKPSRICYDQDGKPFLKGDHRNISISHSGNLVTLILSDTKIGIDAEQRGRDISHISGRFLSEEELLWTSESEDPGLAMLYCWCCKESIYKLMGIKNLQFKNSIRINPVKLKDLGEGKAICIRENKHISFRIHYFMMEDNLITWCREEGSFHL